MRSSLKFAAAVFLAATASLAAVQAPAFAYSGCERYAKAPTFSGDNINGNVWTTCSRIVARADLHGRIKEDRNNLPDAVLDHEKTSFEFSSEFTVETNNCQDNDMIYTEAQINNESPAQSSRREMNC